MGGAAIKEGLSFDDVLLMPQQSSINPSEADTRTTIAPGIELAIPVLSSPMDRVTGSRMAIAIARDGGVGVIHRNQSVEAQAAEVDKVKRSEHGIIVNPISLSPNESIGDALEIMERYHISGVPVTQAGGVLVGILTNRDIRFETINE